MHLPQSTILALVISAIVAAAAPSSAATTASASHSSAGSASKPASSSQSATARTTRSATHTSASATATKSSEARTGKLGTGPIVGIAVGAGAHARSPPSFDPSTDAPPVFALATAVILTRSIYARRRAKRREAALAANTAAALSAGAGEPRQIQNQPQTDYAQPDYPAMHQQPDYPKPLPRFRSFDSTPQLDTAPLLPVHHAPSAAQEKWRQQTYAANGGLEDGRLPNPFPPTSPSEGHDAGRGLPTVPNQ
ncbi:hypothetical protein HWV62_7648 [Athelia sp. TMB]|nr:hypothetical protein HWV62_7648 [Athelia sp. TMB]